MKKNYKYFGFTIIELSITVTIIGIIAAILVVNYNSTIEQSKIGQAKAELTELAGLIRTAVAKKGEPLHDITGNEWTMSFCVQYSANPNVLMSTLPKTNRCWTDYIAAVNAIADAAVVPAPEKLLDGDPWGAPYLIDENETEENCNVNDSLTSAGKKNIPFRPTTITIDMSRNYSQPC